MPDWRTTFIEDVSPVEVEEPLAEFVGAIEAGSTVEYGYDDAVKVTGQSSPTVAGAYRVVLVALEELYGDGTPVRGEIEVEVRGRPEDAGYGPMVQVVSLITGAGGPEGFGGLRGHFVRRDLMEFDEEEFEPHTFLFRRTDTGEEVEVKFDSKEVEPDQRIPELVGLVLDGEATESDERRLKKLWQNRVREILDQSSDVVEVRKPN